MFGSMSALVVPNIRAVAAFRFLGKLLHTSVKLGRVEKGLGINKGPKMSKATKGHERLSCKKK